MIRRALAVLRRQGWRGVWFGALARVDVYRRLDLVELELDELPPLAPNALELDIGFLRPDELDALDLLGGQWRPAEARERLERGERCFAARDGAVIVSARWIAAGKGRVEYLDASLSLAEGEVYLYESFTRPDRRGESISPALGTRLARALASEGCRRIVATGLPESREARRAAEKVGYRRTGRMGYVKLGPWRRVFLRRGDPAS